MAKAEIVTPGGATVLIEGTAEEIAVLIKLFDSKNAATEKGDLRKDKPNKKIKTGPRGHIEGLIESGFFEQPRGLGSIKSALEEQGQFYPVTSLSPVVLRLVRERELRRIKNNKQWTYVH